MHIFVVTLLLAIIVIIAISSMINPYFHFTN